VVNQIEVRKGEMPSSVKKTEGKDLEKRKKNGDMTTDRGWGLGRAQEQPSSWSCIGKARVGWGGGG